MVCASADFGDTAIHVGSKPSRVVCWLLFSRMLSWTGRIGGLIRNFFRIAGTGRSDRYLADPIPGNYCPNCGPLNRLNREMMMSSDSRECPHLLHMYVPRRSVYGSDIVLQRPTEEILIVRRSVLSRVAFLAVAAVIGCLTSLYLYWAFPLIRLQEFRVTDEKVLGAGLAAAGLLWSLAGAVNMLFKSPIQFDRVRGTVGRGGWIPGWWERNLADVVAVQVCQGKSEVLIGDRRDKITLMYQVNLVFRDWPPTRRNIGEHKDLYRVKHIGRQIADFLNVPLLNYVGPLGTVDAADAEARRLLT